MTKFTKWGFLGRSTSKVAINFSQRKGCINPVVVTGTEQVRRHQITGRFFAVTF